jgi:acyl transferase domain-containing protein/surfactin synthase thioesterase subunit
VKTSDERVLRLLREARHKLESERQRRTEPIAIVGIGCRFPGGASNPAAFWQVLASGVDATSEVPADRWNADALFDPDPAAPGKCYVKRGGFLDAIDGFEPEFFGISPREAVGLDPQQRLLLEVVWEALEEGGIAPDSLRASATGVWVGLSLDDYAGRSIGSGDLSRIDPYSALGNARSIAAGRIAYVLDLHGPVMQLDASCASSLVAVHLACQSLRASECDLAVASGVNVMSSPEATVALCKLQALARDGRCKTFDAAADGYGRGEGCGVVVLKRLADALAATDRIHAVIRGSAINHDGRSNGLTAPNGAAQEAVIRTALGNAGLEAWSVGYVEAHGTGTLLGDPIEVLALNRVYGPGRSQETPLYLGSVKTNFGHLEGAAGIAGLIKAVLCLSHRRLAPHLHLRQPNPKIPWRDLAVRVVTEAKDWPDNGVARVAGVSAFGISGTNAHVLVEEATVVSVPHSAPARSSELVVLSARTDAGLKEAARRLSEHVQAHGEITLGDVAYSLATTRSCMEQRLALVVPTRRALCSVLDTMARGGLPAGAVRGNARESRGKLAWLFPGQGAQLPGMGRALYDEWPAFRDALDAAFSALDRHLDRPLREVMWADPGAAEAQLLHETAYAQPALFALGWALAVLWRWWGLQPDLVMGHSIGEITAACVAGVFTLEDAARLVCARGRLMQSLQSQGAMVAIAAPEAEVARALEPFGAVTMAAVNGPSSVVISGDEASVMAVAATFRTLSVEVKRLSVSHAFHSAHMDPMLDAFSAVAASVAYRRPWKAVVVSNLSGRLADAEIATARHWVRHVREPVRFSEGVQALEAAGAGTFIEMGPKATLLPLVAASLSGLDALLLTSGRAGGLETEAALLALAAWAAHGGDLDWKGVFPSRGRRVELPTYPWQRQRYWIEPSVSPLSGHGTPTGHPLLGVRVALAGVEAVYESVVSIKQPGWLGDHRIGRRLVLPAAALLELIRAAADDHRGDAMANVEKVVIERPLTLADGAQRRVQVVVTHDAARVFSQPAQGAAAWTLHATAELGTTSVRKPSRLDLSEIRRRCTQSLDVAATYESLKRAFGLEYGPSFQRLKSLSKGEGEALADVEMNDSIDAKGYGLHPALVEAAARTLAHALCPEADGVFMPVEFKGVDLYQSAAFSATAHARLCAAPRADEVRLGLTLSDSTGAPIASVSEVTFRRVDPSVLEHDSTKSNIQPFYRIEWRAAEAAAHGGSLAGRWLVVGAGDHAEALAAELAAMGARSEIVSVRMLREAGLAEHVVCLWEVGPEAEAAIRGATLGLAVVQALAGAAQAPRLWWVTRNAVAVVRGDEVRPGPSTLWGLGRTIMQEHPELRCTLVDLSPEASAARALTRELAAQDDEAEVAWRHEQRHVARLVRAPRERAPSGDSSAPLRTDGTVLITGGLGALGLEAARSFARLGVKHLVLIGRRGLDTPGAPQAVAELEALGTSVTVAAVDVTNRDALSRVLASVPLSHPLRAIIHAAAVLDDGLLSEQTPERFARVMAPKVGSAWNLHLLSLPLRLDRFVLFSSLAGTLGSPGQGGYAAANAFLDALASHRQAGGLAGLSLAWGPWEARGLTAKLDSNQRARLARQGIGMLSASEGPRLFEEAIARPEAELVVAAIDLPVVATGAGAAVAPVWRALVRQPALHSSSKSTWAREFARLPTHERLAALTEVVRAEVANVLSLPSSAAVPVDAPLQDLGVDSLMALEIRNGIGHRTGMTLPAPLLLHRASADAIAKNLISVEADRRKGAGLQGQTAVARCEKLNDVQSPHARLFCFHDAGGSPAIFASFGQLATAGVEIHAVSHTRNRTPSGEVAAQYLREAVAYVRSASDRPFALFGHSLGSVLAWRVVKELAAAQGAVLPVLLVASGSLPPESLGASLLGEDLETAFRLVFGASASDLPNLRRDLEADMSLWRSMSSPEYGPLEVPIAAFRGADDNVVSESQMRLWARCTTKDFSLTLLPGTHFYLAQDSSRRRLLEELALRLRPQASGQTS